MIFLKSFGPFEINAILYRVETFNILQLHKVNVLEIVFLF